MRKYDRLLRQSIMKHFFMDNNFMVILRGNLQPNDESTRFQISSINQSISSKIMGAGEGQQFQANLS